MTAGGDHDPRLQLVPASARSRLSLFLIIVVLPVLIVAVLPHFLGDATTGAISRLPFSGLLPRDLLAPLLAALVVVPIWAVVDVLIRRHRLGVSSAGLDIVTTLFHRRLSLQDLQLDVARVIDLDEYPGRKPFLKTGGFSAPGFKSGWFLSRELQPLFAATAGGKRVLWLPTNQQRTRRNYTLLLQPRSPQALLDRLRALAAPTPHR